VKAALVALGLVLAPALAGCGAADTDKDGPTLTVLAASSLTDIFTKVAAGFEAEHPGAHVRLVFDSSATLAQQAQDHAPGDVLATADEQTMQDARAGDGIDGDPVQFATNVIVLAVPKDNPARITDLSDLDSPDVDYLTCVPTAPCGSAAQALLAQAAITRKPVSEEVDVRSVLGKVEAGEADAGLVYRTDVAASDGTVTGIAVPGADDRPNSYWVAVTANAADGAASLARAWIDYLTTTPGQTALRAAGFGAGG
jgi:molybdate transport system substrate-binding protein